jgi:L-rhamnose mutarotase
MQRHGMVIRIRPERLDDYKRLHAAVWPEVLEVIRKANISNFTIFHRDGLLFGCFEYLGRDLERDFAWMNEQPVIRRWYQETEPCQQPVETAAPGQWWAPMEEVFHSD